MKNLRVKTREKHKSQKRRRTHVKKSAKEESQKGTECGTEWKKERNNQGHGSMKKQANKLNVKIAERKKITE